MITIQDIATELKKWRNKNSLSLAAAAIKLNVSESKLRRWEQEGSQIACSYLPTIIKVCGFEIESFQAKDLAINNNASSESKELYCQVIAAKDETITALRSRIVAQDIELASLRPQ